VWRAWDSELAREVAIKLVDDEVTNSRSRRALERQVRANAGAGQHRNVLAVYELGDWDGRPFVTMRYAPRGSVADALRSGPLPAATALRWLDETAAALDNAHARGVLHRDLKPSNLLLGDEGEVLVADFGMAAALDGRERRPLELDDVSGTPGYVAPEQLLGTRATPAADRYALAAIAFELLTGTRPFARPTAAAEAQARLQVSVPSACSREPSLNARVDRVFRRALTRRADARYANCAQFVAALRAAVSEPADEPVAVLVGSSPARALAPVAAMSRYLPSTPRRSPLPRLVSGSALAFAPSVRERWESSAVLLAVVCTLIAALWAVNGHAGTTSVARETPLPNAQLPVVPPSQDRSMVSVPTTPAGTALPVADPQAAAPPARPASVPE